MNTLGIDPTAAEPQHNHFVMLKKVTIDGEVRFEIEEANVPNHM